ncbi:MAG: hypothetical protein BZY80_03705 [SAR202 cluster bacterium Io17-Chloro-G2]|nr:MAG: hypothetical protein BZY80_03705 [SAR202 cluster bacterium Io17-Chloro-G2]
MKRRYQVLLPILIFAIAAGALATLFVGNASASNHRNPVSLSLSSTTLAPGDTFTATISWPTGAAACGVIAQFTEAEGWQRLQRLDWFRPDPFVNPRILALTEPGGFTPGPGLVRVSVALSPSRRVCDRARRIRPGDTTGSGAFTFADVAVTKGSDNNPPDCSKAAPSVSSLWPPNHKFKPVNITGVTDPDEDPITINVDSIMQDEPVNGSGDGNTSPDGVGVGTDTGQVRAERSGAGDGRVYVIGYTASDGQGGKCDGTVDVGVPHDKKGAPAVNSGAIYDSTTP